MKAVNKTNKRTKFEFVVDITNANNVNDVAYAIAQAKREVNLPLTSENIDALINHAVEEYEENCDRSICVVRCECCDNVRKPWYKRFWNWLVGRK